MHLFMDFIVRKMIRTGTHGIADKRVRIADKVVNIADKRARIADKVSDIAD